MICNRAAGAATSPTDGGHGSPIFPSLAKDIKPARFNQQWGADLTYVAVMGGFVHLAIIPNARSRRVAGYALSHSIDARLTFAALRVAIERCRPAAGLTNDRHPANSSGGS